MLRPAPLTDNLLRNSRLDADATASGPMPARLPTNQRPMDAEVLICSHPRSGGRWLRYLLGHYLATRRRLEVPETPDRVFRIVPDHHDETRRGYPAYAYAGEPEVPLVAVCHQPYVWDRHRGYPVIFLARNAYDVIVSGFHHLSQEKGEYSGTMREFIAHPTLGIASWIRYMNAWAPRLLTHRDATFLAYGDLSRDPAAALTQVLDFLDEEIDEAGVRESVEMAASHRSSRKIRTGQEGNFWDHLQPEELFEIQSRLREGLSEVSIALLGRIGVEVDPFPRTDNF